MKIVDGYVVLQRQKGVTGNMTGCVNYATEEAALVGAETFARANPAYEYFIATPSVVVRIKPTPVEVEEVRL